MKTSKLDSVVSFVTSAGLVGIIVLLFVGGCRLDYKFQKQKYPNLTLGGYIWHKLGK